MQRCFAMDGHIDIGKTDQKWIGHMVSAHH